MGNVVTSLEWGAQRGGLDFKKKNYENPKTVGVDTYYYGRNIFYFHMDSNLASASIYDRCAL
jgi:hypothetical protein